MRALSRDSLRTITGKGYGHVGLAIDTHGPSVELPTLEIVKDELVVRSDISLPALTLVTGKLTLEDSMSAPVLAEVRGDVFVDAAVTSVSFPSLVSAYSLRFGTARSYVQTIDLPALTILDGGAGASAGTFLLNHPLDLVTPVPTVARIDQRQLLHHPGKRPRRNRPALARLGRSLLHRLRQSAPARPARPRRWWTSSWPPAGPGRSTSPATTTAAPARERMSFAAASRGGQGQPMGRCTSAGCTELVPRILALIRRRR